MREFFSSAEARTTGLVIVIGVLILAGYAIHYKRKYNIHLRLKEHPYYTGVFTGIMLCIAFVIVSVFSGGYPGYMHSFVLKLIFVLAASTALYMRSRQHKQEEENMKTE